MIRTFEVRAGGVPFIRTLEDRAILSLSLSIYIYISSTGASRKLMLRS